MRVSVLTFASIREVVGDGMRTLELPADATAETAWRALVEEFPALQGVERSTRLARNGELVDRSAPLADGDELAVMPPFGGG